jgi:predicted MFS family arabinose efflux permease
MSGFVVQHMGFKAAFFLFAALAFAGAFIFTAMVPETKKMSTNRMGWKEPICTTPLDLPNSNRPIYPEIPCQILSMQY